MNESAGNPEIGPGPDPDDSHLLDPDARTDEEALNAFTDPPDEDGRRYLFAQQQRDHGERMRVLKAVGSRISSVDGRPLSAVEARESVGMGQLLFQQCWPALFTIVELAPPGFEPALAFRPLEGPTPAMLLLGLGPDVEAKGAALLRDPWEVVPLSEPRFQSFLGPLRAAADALPPAVANWLDESGGALPPPAALVNAADRYRTAFIQLAQQVFHAAGRRFTKADPVLPEAVSLQVRDELLLAAIRAAIERIEATVALGVDHYWTNHDAQDAIIRRLEVLGEAGKQLSGPYKTATAEIPWAKWAGLRDALSHNLTSAPDLGRIWADATDQVPTLGAALASTEEALMAGT